MRHVRSHTKQRPDLLKRHAGNHSSENGKNRPRTEAIRANRTVQACEECSKSHLRCEDAKPCSRCIGRNIACRPLPAVQREFEAAQELDAAQELMDLSNDFEPTDAGLCPEQHSEPLASLIHNEDMVYSEQSSFDGSMPDFLRHMPPLETPLSGYTTPQRPVGSTMNWDLDFSRFDFSLFDCIVPDNLIDTSPLLDVGTTQQTVVRSYYDTDATVRAQAFDQSVWRYMPRSQINQRVTEEPNIAISDGDGDGTPPSHVPPRIVTRERLSYTSRDRLLALILEISSPANSKRIAAGFPSLDLLEGMVQMFFTSPSIKATSFLHVPTFSSNEIHPLLLACIISAGSSSVSDILLQKLGLALHETSRIAMANAIEEDNSSIRNIQYLHMQLLIVEIGMWSGISRKMEIAESFLQPPITMLRRGGRFGRSIWKKIAPTTEDKGLVLQDKWKEWALQESWVRLVFRYFELDRQSSMALLKPPLISYGEMKLPLPLSDALWLAPSATAWKAAYLQDPTLTAKRPTLYDCLEDMEYLNYHPIANNAYLYAIWGMVWEYRQLKSISARTQFADSLLLSSRHQELTKLCEDFRTSRTQINDYEEILIEAILMHLNVSVEEIQTFAGIAGPEEAKHAYPIVRDEVSTAAARQAIWHAFDILRTLDAFPRGSLQNFYAMTAYHAALVLWVYGLLRRTADSNTLDDDTRFFILGEADKKVIWRFIKLNRGEPAIKSKVTQNVIPLYDAGGVIESVLHMLRHNHDATRGGCPSLVESLVQLMESLRLASK
ncbi:hypothetical protein N0V90_013103 [Kalmusia sp. IMI 367209]|nr:hypothetical protein N0V90_013103 [Kalmusia sp. IMI 367209]